MRVPGDKSIGHRVLLLALLARGRSRVRGLAFGDDVGRTRAAALALGLRCEGNSGELVLEGPGWEGLARSPTASPLQLDCGNSGTTARLLLGLLAGRPGAACLSGDASLSRRPMGRVLRPLQRLGAVFAGGETLPLRVDGRPLVGSALRTEVPSAQVKSALLLAGLQAEGTTTVHEARRSRDHTERLLRAMGAPLVAEADGLGWRVVGGCPRLDPFDLTVPGDPSSAAYAVALACLLPESELVVEGLSLNPTRLGFYRLLRRMGGAVEWTLEAEEPEPVGTLRARSSSLEAVSVDGEEVVSAIDELPLLAVVAGAARGTTVIRGAAELRHKESDRIAAASRLLAAAGVEHEVHPDGLSVQGGREFLAAEYDASGDHRIAMCATVAAALAPRPSALRGAEWVRVSYPRFFADLAALSSKGTHEEGAAS